MWLWDGLANSLRMLWEVWWALVLGFTLSGIVQAWVPRRRLEHALGARGARDVARATGLGAASSSCSYAAVAIAKSLFEKGASLVSAMSFQFASTNLVFELGIVLWLFIGWQFTLAEFVGGLVLIALMWAGLSLLVSPIRERALRRRVQAVDGGHQHPTATTALPLRQKLTSVQAWSDVAHNFRGDWRMLWKEITAGFLIAGYVATLPSTFFNALFLTHSSGAPRVIENALVGPVVAALAFVCSIGNVPLAAVLWASGISFSGVLAFLYADLIVLPIINYYRKVLRRPVCRTARRGDVRGDGHCCARRRCRVLAARTRPEDASLRRLDRRASDHLELHVGARHPLHGCLRGADRADTAAWCEGSRLRDDR